MGGELGDVDKNGTGKGGWEDTESEDGGGDMGKGVGGMVLSMAVDTLDYLVVMSSEVKESLWSTCMSSSSLMSWYSLSPNILDHAGELKSGRSSALVATVVNQSSKTNELMV